MLSYFRYSVTAVLSKVASLLGISSAPNSLEAKWFLDSSSGSFDVVAYFHILQLEYDRAQLSVKDIKRLRVMKARLVKSKSAAEHEYVSVKVVEPEGASFYLAIERFQGEIISVVRDQDADTTRQETRITVDNEVPGVSAPTHQSTSDSHILPTSIRHSSDSSSTDRYADDKVTYPNSFRKGFHALNDDAVYGLDLSDSSTKRPLYLYELVVLAKLLHDIDPEYLLRNRRRYFYAGTILQVLQEVCGVKPNFDVVVNMGDSAEGDDEPQLVESMTAKNGKKDRKKNKAGKWKGPSVTYVKLSASNLKLLLESFDREVKAFEQHVIDTYNERQAEIDRVRAEVIAAVEEEKRAGERILAAMQEETRQKLAAVEEEKRAGERILAAMQEETRQELAAVEEEKRAGERILAAMQEMRQEHDRLRRQVQTDLANASTAAA